MRSLVHKSFPQSFRLPAALAALGVSALALAWWSFAGDASRTAPEGRIASYQKSQEPVSVDSTPFRYGPDINHGRAGMPVNAREQALRGADEARDAHAEAYRPTRERRGRSASESLLNRGLKSGH